MNAEDAAAKRRHALGLFYKDFYKWLLLKFYQWDPQCIIYPDEDEGCFQEDEYSPEVSRILPLFRKAKSAEDLAQRMHAIFVEMFDADMAGSVDVYQPFAREILDEWHERCYRFGSV